MTFPWLLAVGAIGWTVIGVLVALVVGRFIRGTAYTPPTAAPDPAAHWRDAMIE